MSYNNYRISVELSAARFVDHMTDTEGTAQSASVRNFLNAVARELRRAFPGLEIDTEVNEHGFHDPEVRVDYIGPGSAYPTRQQEDRREAIIARVRAAYESAYENVWGAQSFWVEDDAE